MAVTGTCLSLHVIHTAPSCLCGYFLWHVTSCDTCILPVALQEASNWCLIALFNMMLSAVKWAMACLQMESEWSWCGGCTNTHAPLIVHCPVLCSEAPSGSAVCAYEAQRGTGDNNNGLFDIFRRRYINLDNGQQIDNPSGFNVRCCK